ncbi:hypothetical protein QBC34DRAFT_431971 [Podospora aff. communis PSN243]|uniref:Cell wall mannoprotein PIR1-like C-terminal domain-containing protein n=1 Tax=Podospora aff. communis PSN243 TaxID=3040156 RepID=A0AAV9FZ48_9PEZI|nr:hypothetical protein QBC34DRAFT_431971 [Podospora aff. communis PSN243]
MKLLSSLTLVTALLPGVSYARWFPIPRGRAKALPVDANCEFTLSSAEPFVCPAGQLEDGQIRLNGSYATSSFHISANGGIVDSDGFGCIVTVPTTQFQCDHGKPPTLGFSIDSTHNFLYHGSPSFFACPATDTEYNIYVKPDFGQAKCFPITLKTSGCGSSQPPPLPPPPPPQVSTVWETQTQTVTQDVTQTVTVNATASATCTATGWNTTFPKAPCKHCTKMGSTLLPSEGGDRVSTLPISTNAAGEGLVKRHLGGKNFATRDVKRGTDRRVLHTDWDQIRVATNTGASETDLMKWVRTGQVRYFPVRAGLRIATDYYFGCTVFVVAGTRGLYFGHIAQVGRGGCRPLEKDETTLDQIVEPIRDADDVRANGWDNDKLTPSSCPDQRWAIIAGTVVDAREDGGPNALKDFFFSDEPNVPPGNVLYSYYTPPTGTDNAITAATPRGKAVVTVTDGQPDTDGNPTLVLTVYMNNETPRLTLRFLPDSGEFPAGTTPQVMVAHGGKRQNGGPAEKERRLTFELRRSLPDQTHFRC